MSCDANPENQYLRSFFALFSDAILRMIQSTSHTLQSREQGKGVVVMVVVSLINDLFQRKREACLFEEGRRLERV